MIGREGQSGGIIKGPMETYREHGCIDYYNCGNDFAGYSYVKTYRIVQVKYVCQL